MCARDLFWYHYSVCGETGFGGIKPTTSEKIDSLTQAKRFWGEFVAVRFTVYVTKSVVEASVTVPG